MNNIYILANDVLFPDRKTVTYDCTKIPNYKKLTADMFAVEWTKIITTGWNESLTYTYKPTITYNADTGILSILYNTAILSTSGGVYGNVVCHPFAKRVIL